MQGFLQCACPPGMDLGYFLLKKTAIKKSVIPEEDSIRGWDAPNMDIPYLSNAEIPTPTFRSYSPSSFSRADVTLGGYFFPNHYKIGISYTNPHRSTILHKFQQLWLGCARIPQHQEVDVSSSRQTIRQPGWRGNYIIYSNKSTWSR